MKRVFQLSIIIILLNIDFAEADIAHGINIDFVTIGNKGNLADAGGYGAVTYNYRISKYEVTNAQWSAFTSNAGAPTGNAEGYDKNAYFTKPLQPTNNVSWYEAAQFCNYLTSGDKSKGAYLFSGNNTDPASFIGIDRTTAQKTYGTIYVIPTEDEWYKAAYHKNDGVTGDYWLYPTQSSSTPSNDLVTPDPGNNANYYESGYTIGPWDYVSSVGAFANSESAYGTFDQGGNVWEWNETLIGSNRGYRGGAWGFSSYTLQSSYRSGHYPGYEFWGVGFRVASIPEPGTLGLLAMGVLALMRQRKQ